MVDRDEIRACMARKGLNQTQVALEIGISLTSFVLKMQNKRQFTEEEIKALVNVFGKGILILQ